MRTSALLVTPGGPCWLARSRTLCDQGWRRDEHHDDEGDAARDGSSHGRDALEHAKTEADKMRAVEMMNAVVSRPFAQLQVKKADLSLGTDSFAPNIVVPPVSLSEKM